MKLFAVCALAALTVSCASVPRSTIRYAPPSVNPVRQKVTSAQTHISSAAASAKATRIELEAIAADKETTDNLREIVRRAMGDIDTLQTELASAQEDLAIAQTKTNELEGKVSGQTEELNRQVDMTNAAIAARDVDRKHAHRLKGYAAILAAAAAGFIAWHFKSLLLLLGPYGMIGLAAIPAAAAAAVWMFL